MSYNLLIRCFIFFQHELSTFVCERQQLIHFYCYGRFFATALPRLLTSWKRRDRRSGVINTLSGTLNAGTKAPNLERRHTVSEITDIKGNYYILCKRILLSFLRLESLYIHIKISLLCGYNNVHRKRLHIMVSQLNT